MKVGMSGTIDGVPWPPAGKEIDLPERHALKLLRSDQAEVVRDGPREERAVMPDRSETRIDPPSPPLPPKAVLSTKAGPVKRAKASAE